MKNQVSVRGTFVAVIAALFVVASFGGVEAQQVAPDQKVVDAGKKLYASQGCAKCHQIAGQGSKISVLDGVGSKLTAAELRLWLTNPEEMMAKLPKRPVVRMRPVALEAADLDALVAYMQTLKKQ